MKKKQFNKICRNASVGGMIKVFRNMRKMSQDELGRRVFLTGSEISRIENHHRYNMWTIQKIFRALEIRPLDVLLFSRFQLGLTQTELGKRVGLTPSAVCRIEKGQNFKRSTINGLFDAMNISYFTPKNKEEMMEVVKFV